MGFNHEHISYCNWGVKENLKIVGIISSLGFTLGAHLSHSKQSSLGSFCFVACAVTGSWVACILNIQCKMSTRNIPVVNSLYNCDIMTFKVMTVQNGGTCGLILGRSINLWELVWECPRTSIEITSLINLLRNESIRRPWCLLASKLVDENLLEHL